MYDEEIKKWNNYKKIILKNRIYIFFHGKKRFVLKKYYDRGYAKFDFDNPISYNEKLQCRKLKKNNLMNMCADKNRVREYVSSKIGDKYLIPQYFCKSQINISDLEKLPDSFILKTSNGSGTNKIVFDKSKENLNDICKLMNYYTTIKYGYIWGEFYYNNIPITIVAEELLKDKNGNIPNDLKIHCFNDGKEKHKFIECFYRVDGKLLKNIYDDNWDKINYVFGFKSDGRIIEKPSNLSEIIDICDKLSSDTNYARIDLYNVEGKLYFGEITFIPGAGYSPFDPKSADELWGTYMGKEK